MAMYKLTNHKGQTIEVQGTDYPEFSDKLKEEYYRILKVMVAQENYLTPGNRNDYMVDTSIACRILGINVEDMLLTMKLNDWLGGISYYAAQDKAEVIDEYVDGWIGRDGTHGDWYMQLHWLHKFDRTKC